jgi:DNA (cytosine-5)-methyltransferase 1
MANKYLKFALAEINFPEPTYKSRVEQKRSFVLLESVRRRGNWRYISLDDAEQFIKNLKEMSVCLTYEDVKLICEKYGDVLNRPRKRGMRGQRNFTGKVEDEIRGKLSELGAAKFCEMVGGIKFEPNFDILAPGLYRDEGDFLYIIKDGKKIPLPTNLLIAVKSTNGFFALAIPENEWDWPGEVYISVRLHIKEAFLLKLLNKSLGIEQIDLSEKIGWLEIMGYVRKSEIEDRAFVGTRLPGKYHASDNDWDRRNYIMHQSQLHMARKEFEELLKIYANIV